ncbi:hypothetical protein GTY54_01675 [Streptomyces sp. SID625]|nr:hypothetical protein [Streptomyces sp. SID625]
MQTPEDRGTGWAPYGSSRRMRVLAWIGSFLAVGLVIGGIAAIASGASGGVTLCVIGGILVLFWVFAIPAARKKRKM